MKAMPVSSLIERFDAALAAAGTTHAGRPFLVAPQGTVGFGDLEKRLGAVLALFADRSLAPGSRIAVVTADPLAFGLLALGALRAGVALLPLDPAISVAELEAAVEVAGIDHLFIDARRADGLTMAHTPIAVAVRGGGLLGRFRKKQAAAPKGFWAELDAASPMALPSGLPDDGLALLLRTSGTTDKPKVVMLTAANIAAQIGTFLDQHGYDAEARILNPLPTHHTDGLMHGPVIAFFAGATLHVPPLFTVQGLGDLLDTVYRERITHFVVVPAILGMMRRMGDAYDSSFSSPEFRFIRSSADYLDPSLWKDIEARFNVRVTNTYGLSETVCEAIYCGPDAASFRHGTVGKPRDCEVRIADGAGAPVTDGRPGELLIRGDNIMAGYLDRQDLTDEAIRDGWLHTGDFAQIDGDGFVTITGRKKTLIISGGINVHPQEVQGVVMATDGVGEAHVFGLPDPIFGERIVVAMVPADPAVMDDDATKGTLVDRVKAACADNLAPAKQPHTIVPMAAFPRTASGKVRVDALAEGLKAGAAGNLASLPVEDQVIAIAADVFRVDAAILNRHSTPDNVAGWTSLEHMALVTAAEEHFKISLPARAILGLNCLGDLVDTVERNR